MEYFNLYSKSEKIREHSSLFHFTCTPRMTYRLNNPFSHVLTRIGQDKIRNMYFPIQTNDGQQFKTSRHNYR